MLSVALASACWQYFVRLLQPSFLRIRRIIFQRYFIVKSHLKYLHNYKSRKLSFACISSLMALKVLLPAHYFFSSGNHILLVALNTFQVTGLTFSPHKCKVIVCIHARTREAKVLTE